MEQDYLITKSEEKALPEDKPEIKKTDPHIKILIMQGAICVAIIIVCLIIKTFFAPFFSEIKDWYEKQVGVDTNISQMLENTSAAGGPIDQSLDLQLPLNSSFALPVNGTVSSVYGYRTDPFTGEIAAHNGLDIAAKAGSDIFAALDGTVELASHTNGDYGNYIIINHGAFKTLYGHCQSLKVKKGDKVLAGQVIATCGSTGRSTGPHLHFEIRIGDRRIDPTPFLKYN